MPDNTLEIIIAGKDQATSVFSNIGKLFLGGGIFGLGMKAAQEAVNLVTGSIGGWVQGAMDAQGVQAQLNSVLKATGWVAGVTAGKANELASSLMGVTTFEDEAILSGENLLLTFKNIGSDVFPTATEAMLDMSTAMGQDIKSSAIQLGKALNDPIAGMTALSRVGVTFSEAQKKAIEQMMKTGDLAGAQKVILDELASEFGGAAQAAGGTFAGQLKILTNNLTDMAEGIIGSVLPAGQQILSEFIMPLIPAIQDLAGKVSEWLVGVALPALFQFADWFINVGWPAVQAFLAPIIAQLIPGLKQLGAWVTQIAQAVFPLLVQAIQFVIDRINIFGPILAAIGVVILALTSPISLVIAAIVLLATAWANNWGGIREKTEEVINFLRPFIEGAITAIQQFWTDHGEQIVAIVQTMWNNIQKAFVFWRDLFMGVFDAFKLAFQGDWRGFGEKLREVWDEAWRKIKEAVSQAIEAIKKVDWGAVGKSILQGIANGITAGLSIIRDAAVAAAKAALEAAKGFLGIHSPSRAFAEIGRNIMAGMAMGVENNAALPVRATVQAAGALAAATTNNYYFTQNVQAGSYDTAVLDMISLKALAGA